MREWRKDTMKKVVLSVFVDNTSGVLNRVAGHFIRRNYNIDNMTVSETNNTKN